VIERLAAALADRYRIERELGAGCVGASLRAAVRSGVQRREIVDSHDHI